MSVSLDEIIPLTELAERSGKSYHAIYQRVKRKRVPTIKHGWALFIRLADVKLVGINLQ